MESCKAIKSFMRQRWSHEALLWLELIDPMELCNKSKLERCRATMDLRSCGRYVQTTPLRRCPLLKPNNSAIQNHVPLKFLHLSFNQDYNSLGFRSFKKMHESATLLLPWLEPSWFISSFTL